MLEAHTLYPEGIWTSKMRVGYGKEGAGEFARLGAGLVFQWHTLGFACFSPIPALGIFRVDM